MVPPASLAGGLSRYHPLIMPRRTDRRLALPLLALLSLLPLTARSQPRLAGEPPTAGVAVPAGALAGDAESTAVDLNPANLAFLPSWNVMFLHTELSPAGTQGGRGDALFVASSLPFFRPVALGLAVESMRPPERFFPLRIRNQARLAFAAAWRPTPMFSIGATYAHIFMGDVPVLSDGTQPHVADLDTLDLAISTRPSRFFALSLTVHDVPSPKFLGLPLQRVYEPELAVRPFGNRWAEVAVAVRVGERRGDAHPRVRLQLMPYPGLILRAALEVHRDEFDDGRRQSDLQAVAGLELNFEHIGLGGYVFFGSANGTGNLHGGTASARASGDRYPSLVLPRRLERIELSRLDERGLAVLLAHLRQLERRPRTDGVVLVLGEVSGAWARIEELREALLRLRHARRHVYAFGSEMGSKAYYLATAAERVFLDPAGDLRLLGMTSTALYFKGTFDKLGVRADFVRVAEYKSAPEQWMQAGPSPEARAQRERMSDDIFRRVVETIAQARHVDADRTRAWIDGAPYTPAEALRLGLIDEVRSGDEVERAIGERLGHRVRLASSEEGLRQPASFAPPLIGVIVVEGDIIEGKSQTLPILNLHLVGHETIVQALHQARIDPRVRAVVLRIASPGGSAYASDLIAREVARLRKMKPTICSLGDVAASGGYFIAAACDLIFASPSTVTGSIGIFTGKFDVAGLADKLGISRDTIKRGARADMESYWRPYTDEERRLLGERLLYYYERFLTFVASQRNLTRDQVDRVAHGRVWTGAEAYERKLIDRLGGFADAVDEAKRRARLREWEGAELKEFTGPKPTLLRQLMRLLGTEVDNPVAWLGSASVAVVLSSLPASLWVAPSTPQARLDYALQIE